MPCKAAHSEIRSGWHGAAVEGGGGGLRLREGKVQKGFSKEHTEHVAAFNSSCITVQYSTQLQLHVLCTKVPLESKVVNIFKKPH
jgi:hypothetical protein